MKDVSCNTICDLIPLVRDGVASKDSINMVFKHMEHCEICRKEFETFKSTDLKSLSAGDENIINTIRRNILITQVIILMLGAIIGVALTGSMGQFYNFIIMPILGALSIRALKDRWYIAFISVFVLSYIGQVLYFIITNQFSWGVLYGSMFYGVVYIVLMTLGVIIFKLLKFALGGEENNREEV